MFLETLDLTGSEFNLDITSISDPNAAAAAMIAMVMAMLVFYLICFVVYWVYTGFAFSAIAKRAKQNSPGLAWIPAIGPVIVAYKASNMASWPWYLLLGIVLMFFAAIPVLGILLAILGYIALIVFAVYTVIWQWKMFEKIGRPGWWAILCLITPINLILYGIAAWGNK